MRDLKSGIIPQTYNEEDEYYKDNVDDSEGRTSGNRVFEIWSWPAWFHTRRCSIEAIDVLIMCESEFTKPQLFKRLDKLGRKSTSMMHGGDHPKKGQSNLSNNEIQGNSWLFASN